MEFTTQHLEFTIQHDVAMLQLDSFEIVNI
jgi:hypothetical protein